MNYANSSDWTPYPLSDATIASFIDNVNFHHLNFMFGAVCFCVNIPLLIAFLTSKSLRTRSQVLIALCVADANNCLSIMFMGLNRVNLYSSILETGYAPVRTAWQCALEPWISLRLVGDLWAPVLQLAMGLERVLAVFQPVVYMRLSKNRAKLITIPSILFVIVCSSVGFLLAYINKEEIAKYYCGRKAAFSTEYGIFIYMTNVIGYSMGLIFNVAAMAKAMSGMTKEGRRQFKKIRYTLSISLLSTILVSIPNIVSALSVVITISNFIKKTSTYYTCINSGLNIFVYFALNEEFRNHVLSSFKLRQKQSTTLFVTRMHSTT